MYDKDMLLEVLKQTSAAIGRVNKRFESVDSVEFFTDTPEGMEKLDAICMVIIAIGESLKNIDKITNHKLLSQYPEIDWKGAKGMRDIISHHYFDVDAEEIFWVCENKMKPLAATIEKIINDVGSI
ncbi:MAG: DUF86 domain-containing protein [Desulfuromonadales bacterium]|nr:DUF86 domain-containing protein [Desulfuromonadales bacterium]